MKRIAFFLLAGALFSCAVNRDIEVSKGTKSLVKSGQSLVYSLPQTVVMVTVEVTKTSTKKGPYAEYASKYLGISNAPMWDSQTYAITDVMIKSQNEADPSLFYTVSFTAYPENLDKLLALSGNGVVLDFAKAWMCAANRSGKVETQDATFDPNITDEAISERVDTLYKTIIKDSVIVKVPVLRKKQDNKTLEEIVQETAGELVKIRKGRLEMLRGEIDEFHPDAATMGVILAETKKQEAEYLSMFMGKRIEEKQYYTFRMVPATDFQTKELCYFSPDAGIKNIKVSGSSSILLTMLKEQEPVKSTAPQSAKNMIFVKVPVMATFSIKKDDEELANMRVPVYHLGQVQALPLK